MKTFWNFVFGTTAALIVMIALSGPKKYDVLDRIADNTEEYTEATEETSSSDTKEIYETEVLDKSLEDQSEESFAINSRPEYDPLSYVSACKISEINVEYSDIEPVTDDEICKEIYKIYQTKDMWIDVRDKIQVGDMVTVDFTGHVNDQSFEGGSGENVSFIIGSNTFAESFETSVIGAQAEEKIKSTVFFPDDYFVQDVAGKVAFYEIEINSVKRLPEITEESVRQASNDIYQTVEEYKEYVKEIIEKDKRISAEDTLKKDILSALTGQCEISEIPYEVLEYDINQNYIYYQNLAQNNNIEFSEYLEQQFGLTKTEFADFIKVSAESSLKEEMKILALAKENGLWITEEEIAKRSADAAIRYGYHSVDEFLEGHSTYHIRMILAEEDLVQAVKDRKENSNIKGEEL